MPREEVKQTFLGMQPDQQLRVLALLALNITVAARTAYLGQVEEHLVVGKLRAFNEVLHTIAGQLLPLSDKESDRYPEGLFIDALFETDRQGDCEKTLTAAFAWSYSTTASPA